MIGSKEDLKRTLVGIANAVTLDDGDDVRAYVEERDIVWALWNEPDSVDGIGMLLIKGEGECRRIAWQKKTERLSIGAVRCSDYQNALLMRRVLGDDRVRH